MTEISVPAPVAVATVVLSAMLNFAIVNAAAVHMSDPVLYALGIVNVGITTFAIAVNVRKLSGP